ncbi:MAG: PhoH family protein [Elusimicrobiota bacterium]
MNKTKTFVIDTNVLIHDPKAMFSFADNKVAIPITVIEELDSLKRENDERGVNARSVSRILDSFRQQGKLSAGIKLESGGVLKVELDAIEELPYQFAIKKADHRILGTALNLQKSGERVTLVSKDINLRIKAEVLGLKAEDYEKEKVRVEQLYKGFQEIFVSREKIDLFYKNKFLPVAELLPKKQKKKKDEDASPEIHPNEFFILKESTTSSQSALGKYEKKNGHLIPLFHNDAAPWGIKPLNVEQRFAIELLLCNEINLVTLMGVPGAGKTLLALACGLQKVVEEKHFRRLLVARPVIPMGRDIGYLPGTKEEKLSSWMGAIYDNLDFLMDRVKPEQQPSEAVNYLFDTGLIEIEALTFIRGRSLPEQFIIIDDAQNLTPHEVKTIISRAGHGTKIILTGDPYQIDNPYLDSSSNGLNYLVQRFKGQITFGHLNFTRSERSPLAALASELL